MISLGIYRGAIKLLSAKDLTSEEQQVAYRVDQYFKSPSMTIHEKLFNALLIAQLELDEENFSNENERNKIVQFKNVLDGLLQKIKT